MSSPSQIMDTSIIKVVLAFTTAYERQRYYDTRSPQARYGQQVRYYRLVSRMPHL